MLSESLCCILPETVLVGDRDGQMKEEDAEIHLSLQAAFLQNVKYLRHVS